MTPNQLLDDILDDFKEASCDVELDDYYSTEQRIEAYKNAKDEAKLEIKTIFLKLLDHPEELALEDDVRDAIKEYYRKVEQL